MAPNPTLELGMNGSDIDPICRGGWRGGEGVLQLLQSLLKRINYLQSTLYLSRSTAPLVLLCDACAYPTLQ